MKEVAIYHKVTTPQPVAIRHVEECYCPAGKLFLLLELKAIFFALMSSNTFMVGGMDCRIYTNTVICTSLDYLLISFIHLIWSKLL